MTAIETESRIRETTHRPAAVDWQTTCLNCGSQLGGAYCSECGQRDAPPHPSLRELGGEAFAELSGWDGKFAETVRALLRKPGKLTVEFLEGRRARYLSPLRLYLTCSVIYFLIAAAVPSNPRSSFVVRPGPTAGAVTPRNLVDAEHNPGLTAEDRAQIARLDRQGAADPEAVYASSLERRQRVSERDIRIDAEGVVRATSGIRGNTDAVLSQAPLRRASVLRVAFARVHFHRDELRGRLKLTHVMPLVQVVSGIAVLLWLPTYGAPRIPPSVWRNARPLDPQGNRYRRDRTSRLRFLRSSPLALWVASRG